MATPHPGQILDNELAKRKISQKDLAIMMGKTAPLINGILKGDKNLTVEIALLLEAALTDGPTAAEWMRMQYDFELETEKQKESTTHRAELIRKWMMIREHVNVSSLKKRLALGSDMEGNISQVFSAMGVTSITEFEERAQSYGGRFKMSTTVQTSPENLLTWTLIAKNDSNSIELEDTFSKDKLPELQGKLNEVFYRNEDTEEKVKALLNSYGIKFINNCKRLDQVPVDGFSFWHGPNPTIVVTKRMDRIDNYAFTIMHELGHIALHLTSDCKRDFIDLDNKIQHFTNDEDQANEYATKALWFGLHPNQIFASIEEPFAAGKALRRISRNHRVNLGIVTGQFQYYCSKKADISKPYAICRNFLEHVQ